MSEDVHDVDLPTPPQPPAAQPPRLFFSVLICAYECGEFIDECLDSLLAQTFPSWECLVIDDASSDDTLAKIRAKVGTDPRFRIYSNAARQTALPNLMYLTQQAVGDHVYLLDGDDYLTRPDALDIVYAVYHDAPDVRMTYGSYIRVPENQRGHAMPVPPGAHWWLNWFFGHPITYRREYSLRSLLKEPLAYINITTGQPYTFTYDLALIYPVAAAIEDDNKRIAFIGEITYAYRIHPRCEHVVPGGADTQTRFAGQIQMYWANEMFKRETLGER